MNEDDANYVRIQTVGRKTGKIHQVLVRFITLGTTKIIAFPYKAGTQDWILNIRKNPEVEIFLPSGGHYKGHSEVKTVHDFKDPILSIFTRKYGMDTVRHWYFGQTIYVELELEELGAVNIEEIIYDDLETAFDGVAEDYDHHIFGNPMNVWLRNVSIGVMASTFSPDSTILEIGCGTGTETLSLARRGINVIATDISGKMIKVLSEKAKKEGLEKKIVTIHCRPPELADKLHERGIGKIDGAYSTYGAINTEPNLPKLVLNLRSILKSDSSLILGVWNKYCAYEIVGYLMKARPQMAFARLRNPVPIGRSRFCVASNAFTVREIDHILGSDFKRKATYGVVVSLPPSNLTKYMPRGGLLQIARKFDLMLGCTAPFNRLGDHFLSVYTMTHGG